MKTLNPPSTADQIDMEELKRLIRKTKDRKASSISGRHHGHYKVWMDHDEIDILILNSINLPRLHDISPSKWGGFLI